MISWARSRSRTFINCKHSRHLPSADLHVDAWPKDGSIGLPGRVGFHSASPSLMVLICIDDATASDRDRLRKAYNIKTIMDLRSA